MSLACEDLEELSITTTHTLGLVIGLVNFWPRSAFCCQNHSSVYFHVEAAEFKSSVLCKGFISGWGNSPLQNILGKDYMCPGPPHPHSHRALVMQPTTVGYRDFVDTKFD